MAQSITSTAKTAEVGTFGWRLREALDQSTHTSLRALSREINGHRRLMGSSVHAIGEFLDNEKEPRRDVLVALAEALGVRAAWLAFGDGPMFDDGFSVRSTALYLVKATRAERTDPAETREDFLGVVDTDAKRDYLSLDPFERVAVGYLLARVIEREKEIRGQHNSFDRGRLAGRVLVELREMMKSSMRQRDTKEGLTGLRARIRAPRRTRIWKTHFAHAIASMLFAKEGDRLEAMKKS